MSKEVKSKAKRGLGRGLQALVSSMEKPVRVKAPRVNSSQEGSNSKSVTLNEQNSSNDLSNKALSFLPLTSLVPNPLQPRKEFQKEELQELANSISEHGLIQPILVRPVSIDTYEIVAGERRYRAAKLIKLNQVPVIIKKIEDKECLEIALIENIQRESLSPLEESRAIQDLIDRYNLSQQHVADRLGKSRSSIANSVRLLALPKELQNFIEAGKLSVGHAKAILTVKEPKAQMGLAEKTIKEKLSVRALEEIVGRVVVLDPLKKKKKKVSKETSAFPEVRDQLREKLGTKVKISHSPKSGAGKIEINYFSEDELDRVVQAIISL